MHTEPPTTFFNNQCCTLHSRIIRKMTYIVVKAGEVITDMGQFIARLSKAQTGITFVRFKSASPKIEASQERLSVWNMTSIKGLMKVHARMPFRESTSPGKQRYDTCCYECEQYHLRLQYECSMAMMYACADSST